MKNIDYLLIGHACHDVTPDGFSLGGAVSYSGLTAKRLGMTPGILTSVGDDFLFEKNFAEANIPLHVKPAERTTVFENIYAEGKRTQYLHARASDLLPSDVPEIWRQSKIVQCSPIADEVSLALLANFPETLVGATIQGWLRQWNQTKSGTSGSSNGSIVSPKAMDWSKLAAADVVIFSDEDIRGFESALPQIISKVGVVAMTQGENGCTVWQEGKQQHFPAYPAGVVDATGAGDVFAAAFLIEFSKSENVESAARFANAAASIVVEGKGIERLGSEAQVRERMQA